MKSLSTLSLVAGVLSMITSCALPPREAMRIVQREGLINYLSHDYSHYTHAAPASASPLRVSQTPYTTPRPVASVPYRSTYHTNRYARADYNRVPYRPKHTTSTSRSRSSSSQRSSSSSNKTRVIARSSSSVESPSAANVKSAASSKTDMPSPAPAPVKKPAEALPYGSPVAGRPGMVTSPFAQKQQLVDVTGMAPGDTVKDPYSGKLFRVPPMQQASATPVTKAATTPPESEKPKTESASPSTNSPAPTPAAEAPKTEAPNP